MRYFKKDLIFLFLLFIATVFIWHLPYLDSFPAHMHAWANTDHYAIALGFIENNFDFFHPSSKVFNHQFPNKWMSADSTNITAANFPIINYLAGVCMSFFNTKDPFVFRTITVAFSFIGYYSFYRLSYSYSKNTIRSLLVTFIFFSSPLFIFYQSSFLPSVPALSLVLYGIWKYSEYRKKSDSKKYFIALASLCFAALIRTSFVIPLIAVFCTEILLLLRKEASESSISKKLRIKNLTYGVLGSGAPIIIYLLYNSQLQSKYGSLFLTELMSPDSISELLEIIKITRQTWGTDYFSNAHYVVFTFLGTTSLYQLIKKRKTFLFSELASGLKSFGFIYLLGVLLFLIAMSKQFIHHDYYFLDSLFLPIGLALIYGIKQLPKLKVKNGEYAYALSGLALFFILTDVGIASQENRRKVESWDLYYNSYLAFSDNEQFLEDNQVKKEDKILLLNPYAPNLGFILLDRSGYVLMKADKQKLENILQWNYDHIIIQNELYMSNFHKQFPELISRLKVKSTNGKISLCELTSPNKEQTLSQLILEEERIGYHQVYSCDEGSSLLEKQVTCEGYDIDGGYFLMDAEAEFALETKIFSDDLDFSKKHFVNIKIDAEFFEKAELHLVQATFENDQMKNYQSKDLSELVQNESPFIIKSTETFTTPVLKGDNVEMKIYLWNPKKTKARFKLIDIAIK